MLRAVFFDVGNTLIYTYPSVGEIYSSVGRRYGMDLDPGKVNASFRAAFMRYGTVPLVDRSTEADWWKRIVRETVSAQCEPLDFDGFFRELYDFFTGKEAWRLFPDVLPALEALRARGVTLGIISNWDSRLIPTLENLGLAPYFSVTAVSALVGHAKPDPGIFAHALDRVGVRPEESLHVGDHPELDCLGAKRCGMEALLIDRSQDGGSKASCGRIRSLTEILEHLDG